MGGGRQKFMLKKFKRFSVPYLSPNRSTNWRPPPPPMKTVHVAQKSGLVCHKSRSLYATKVGSYTIFSVKVRLFQWIFTPYNPSFYGIFWELLIWGGGVVKIVFKRVIKCHKTFRDSRTIYDSFLPSHFCCPLLNFTDFRSPEGQQAPERDPYGDPDRRAVEGPYLPPSVILRDLGGFWRSALFEKFCTGSVQTGWEWNSPFLQ